MYLKHNQMIEPTIENLDILYSKLKVERRLHYHDFAKKQWGTHHGARTLASRLIKEEVARFD